MPASSLIAFGKMFVKLAKETTWSKFPIIFEACPTIC